jgi:branched-chain amino acid transport system permease protein
MISIELKREYIIIRYKKKIWAWILEPRYWRNSLIWTCIMFTFPVFFYFTNVGLINTMIRANTYAIIAIPLSLMTLGTGRMNFGPQFYIGVGGFTAALLSVWFGWEPLATLPVAVILTLFSALLFSPLVIVSRGLYYVLLSILLPVLFLEATFIYLDIFKGETGIYGIQPLLETGNAEVNFLIAAQMSTAIMLAYLLVINKMLKSRYGLIMAAINDDEEVAHGIGINISKVKILSFIFSAGMIGVAGWFYAHYLSAFSGRTYLSMTFMIKILLVIFIGGRIQLFGCVIGAYFVALLETVLIRYMGQVQVFVFPAILLILLVFLPEGIWGIYRKRHYREYMPTIHVRR